MENTEKPISYIGARANDKGRRAFEVGEVISGRFTGLSRKPGMGGKEMITLFLETENEKLGLNACGDLHQVFTEAGIQDGQNVKIELVNIRKTSQGYDFRNFNVVAA